MDANSKSQINANAGSGAVLNLTQQKERDDLKILGLVIFCLVLNIVCSLTAKLTGIPFYFDCIGTIVVAIIGGFMPSVLVGFLTNVLSTFLYKWFFGEDTSNLYYCIISVLIALVATIFAQKNFFKKIHIKMVIPLICFVILGGGLGSVITWGLYGNTMGEELASSLAGRIYSNGVNSAFLAQLYAGLIMDVPDKLISTALAFAIYKAYPKKFKPTKDRIDVAALAKKGISLSGKIIIAVTLIFGVVAAAVTGVSLNQFRLTMVESEGQYAIDTAKFAATLVDGNMIDEYIERRDAAEGYYRVFSYHNVKVRFFT